MCDVPQKYITKYDQESRNYTLQPIPRHREEETHSTKDNRQS